MPLPSSFGKAGFVPPAQARTTRVKLPNGRFLRPLLIGTEGETDTGKTEFIWSCPGPGINIVIDRGYEGALDNPRPPQARRLDDFAIKLINPPLEGTTTQVEYASYHKAIRESFYAALAIPEAVTVALDGDSDWWEIHRLGLFGKLQNVWPQTKYHTPYAEKRAIIARANDSGKIVICTNKVKDAYETVKDASGKVVIETDGSEKRQKTGAKERQGFPDQDYLWKIQLKHLYKPAGVNKITGKPYPAAHGIKILKCKHNMDLVGSELWGDDCNFQGLVQYVYPEVPLADWGL